MLYLCINVCLSCEVLWCLSSQWVLSLLWIFDCSYFSFICNNSRDYSSNLNEVSSRVWSTSLNTCNSSSINCIWRSIINLWLWNFNPFFFVQVTSTAIAEVTSISDKNTSQELLVSWTNQYQGCIDHQLILSQEITQAFMNVWIIFEMSLS